MKTYLAFVAADYRAERKPKALVLSAALKQYAVDPALAQAGQFLFQFRRSNWEWRGTPPTTRTTVKGIDSTGQYPTVTIFDCPTTSKTWRPYDAATGKPLKLVKPKVAPPWGTTAKIIFYKNRWMVQTAKVDMSRTCKP